MGNEWNAYDCTNELIVDAENESVLRFMFDTAWSPPAPIFHKIAKMYLALVLETVYIDEGMGFAGRFKAIDGELKDYPVDIKNEVEVDEIYEEAYGYPREKYDEDEEIEGEDEDAASAEVKE